MVWRPVPHYFAACVADAAGELTPLLAGDDLADLDERRRILVRLGGAQVRLVIVWGHDGSIVTRAEADRLLPQPCPRLADGTLPTTARPDHPRRVKNEPFPHRYLAPELPALGDPDEVFAEIRAKRIAQSLRVPEEAVRVDDIYTDGDGRRAKVTFFEPWPGGQAALAIEDSDEIVLADLEDRCCGIVGWTRLGNNLVAEPARACDAGGQDAPAAPPARRPDPPPDPPPKARDASQRAPVRDADARRGTAAKPLPQPRGSGRPGAPPGDARRVSKPGGPA